MKKNVLFILTDGFRSDCLGAAGNPVIQTPHLDALVKEGVLFSNCFAQTTPCSPSRMCIFTGRYLCSTGCVDNLTPLAEAEDNLGMHVRNHGGAPAVIGFHDYAVDPRTLPENDPRRTRLNHKNLLPGFDVLLNHDLHSPEYFDFLRTRGYPEDLCNPVAIRQYDVPPEGPGPHLPLRYPARFRAEDSGTRFATEKAIEYISKNAGKGWFLNLNYITPHGPYICPAPYNDLYDPADMPAPNRRPEERTHPSPYLRRFTINAPEALAEDREWRETRATVYGMITELDACLGRLFRALKKSGQWDNTLIIFSSDHGEHLGDHYLDGKAHYFDSAMHIPYIVRDPSPEADGTRGRTLESLREAIDTAPTICDYLGIPPHEGFQGTSALDEIRCRPGAAPRREIHYEFYYYFSLKPEERPPDLAECRFWMVRDHRYKYVIFGEESMPDLLFDLQEDPGEFTNAAERPESTGLITEYGRRLARWRIRNEDLRMERWTQQYR